MKLDEIVRAIIHLKEQGISAPEAVLYFQALRGEQQSGKTLPDVLGELLSVELSEDEEEEGLGFK